MLFWIMVVAMTALVAALLLRSLLRGTEARPDAEHPDMGVYRSQLAEVDRDLARGVIAESDAGALKIEISRRILDLDRTTRASQVAAGQIAGGIAVPLLTGAAVLAGAIGLYAGIGAAGYGDLPHAQRIARAEALRAERPSQAEAEALAAKSRPVPPAPPKETADLMDKLRAAAAKRPTDVTGLRLLARNERSLGNLAAAVAAQGRLVAVLGAKAGPDDLAALADVEVNAAGGIVTQEAEAAVRATLKLDPANGTARFYAGLLEAQTGRPDRAFALWRGLLDNGPQDAPWVPFIRDQMPFLASAAGVEYTPPEVKGPDAGAVQAAGQMSAEDRTKMISGMVGGLETRLLAQGGTAAEWAQLVTALGVLGETERASVAWAKAQVALADDKTGLETLRDAARQAGVAP